MKKVYFLRHAITDAHVKGRKNATMGFPNIGLNEKGKIDCETVALKLEALNIDCIISSDLLSARETAEIINQHLNVPLYYTSLLRERDQGEFTGKKLDDIYENDKKFSVLTKGNNREELHMFMERTKQAFRKINEDYTWENCLVISHKGFLRTFMATCFGVNPKNWYLCELREITYNEEHSKWMLGEQKRLVIE